jgi:YesN/AraC family two-component response regulator
MLNILIVDDEQQLRSLIKSLLPRELNLRVIGEATNGADGLEKCLKYKPDIVITDIRMPEMDGLSLTQKLAAAMPNVKILIVSGYDEFEYAQKAIQYGAVGYLLKPVEQKELLEVLHKTVEAIAQQQQTSTERKRLKIELSKLQKQLSTDAQKGDPDNALQINSPVIQKVLGYILEHYNQDITLGEIAAAMYMNAAYLSRLFKDKTGQGFQDKLTEIRIQRAKVLLEHPEFRIYEIAEMVGYHDAGHFVELFKQHTGQTPGDYRSSSQIVKKDP